MGQVIIVYLQQVLNCSEFLPDLNFAIWVFNIIQI